MSYKDQIIERVKEGVNGWIKTLKGKHQNLHLTSQWKLVHKNGFLPGYRTVPVVASSKQGPYLIGEVGFQVSDDLDINLNELEFIQKDEPYIESHISPNVQPLSQPLDLLNNLLVGLNEFISETTRRTHYNVLNGSATPTIPIIKPSPINVTHNDPPKGDLDEIVLQLKHRTVLPNWLRAIGNHEVQDTLFKKIAESFVHYKKQTGQSILLSDFIKRYEEYLKQEGKLYSFCTYKAKSVNLDEKGWCEESYCSKKPFQKVCEHAGLKFGRK